MQGVEVGGPRSNAEGAKGVECREGVSLPHRGRVLGGAPSPKFFLDLKVKMAHFRTQC